MLLRDKYQGWIVDIVLESEDIILIVKEIGDEFDSQDLVEWVRCAVRQKLNQIELGIYNRNYGRKIDEET